MDYEALIELLRNDNECDVLDYIEDAATAIEDLLAEREAAGEFYWGTCGPIGAPVYDIKDRCNGWAPLQQRRER